MATLIFTFKLMKVEKGDLLYGFINLTDCYSLKMLMTSVLADKN